MVQGGFTEHGPLILRRRDSKMAEQTVDKPAVSTKFKIGWWILIGLGVLMTLNHLVLGFIMMNEFVLFAGWTGFNLYALVILFVPFRRGEKWAWYASWILAIITASPLLGDPSIAPYYTGASVLLIIGLLLTRSEF